MRVLVVHNRYRSAAPSGENRVVEQESDALLSIGHTVERFEYHSDDIEHWSPWRKVGLPARVVWNPQAKRELAATLETFRPDVVHVHNTFPLLSPSVLYACRDQRVPVVATLHNYKLLCASGDFFRAGKVCHDCADGSQVAALTHKCYRGSLTATAPMVLSTVANRRAWRRLVSAYIFLSASQRKLMAGLALDPTRVFVKDNLVPAAVAPHTARERKVVYMGRLDEAKGVPLLMEAWDQYRAVAGDDALRLVVVGSGPLGDDVARWARTRPSVEMTGYVDRARCVEIVASARAALLPSEWEETFGLVAVEAMAAGTPVIAAGHGSFPEIVTAGHDGELFSPGEAAHLARVVGEVDAQPERFAAYGRNAQETYRRRYDLRAGVAELERIYRFAIDRAGELSTS